MSCWVAPSLAAELWHISIEEVKRLMATGQVAFKEEQGFTFVDLAAGAAKAQAPLRRPEDRPPTYSAAPITDEELSALTFDPPVTATEAEDDEVETGTLGDWRTARLKAGRMRIAPRRRAVA
jgi:hypothetical protein